MPPGLIASMDVRHAHSEDVGYPAQRAVPGVGALQLALERQLLLGDVEPEPHLAMLEHRATRALEARLHALRGTTRRTDRAAFVSRTRPAPVLFRRRFALLACGAAPL